MVVAAMAWAVAATAASDDSARVHRLEAEVVPGIILHTNAFLKGNNTEVRMMNRSFVAHLKYAFMPPEGSREAIIYKGVYQGVGLSYHYFNPQLGNPVSAYLFQGATIKNLSSRLSLNYEWNLGLTYGWKSYDEKNHPENRVIGSKLTATHYSNGNTSIPNAGLNVVGARASVAWYFNRQQPRQEKSVVPPSERYWLWDLTLWGAWKRKGVETANGSYPIPGTYGVAGFHFNPLYHLNHWLNLGASLDASYDGSANIEVDDIAPQEEEWRDSEHDVHQPAWYRKVGLGLSGRVEFVMPYFTINFGVGHNLVNAGSGDLKGFYEILALKIAIMRQAYLHIGYSLYDFHYPNNLILGLGLHL